MEGSKPRDGIIYSPSNRRPTSSQSSRPTSSRYWETVLGPTAPSAEAHDPPNTVEGLGQSSLVHAPHSNFSNVMEFSSGARERPRPSAAGPYDFEVPSSHHSSGSTDTSHGPFRCEVCGWSFRKRTVHGDRKREYVCELCGLAFVERHNRDNHIKVVCGGQKPYPCETCGSRFGRKSSLRQHIQTVHEKQRPYKCNICHHAFGQKSTLAKHKAAVHADARHGIATSTPPTSQSIITVPAGGTQNIQDCPSPPPDLSSSSSSGLTGTDFPRTVQR